MENSTLIKHFKALKVKVALKVVLTGIICILINNIFHLDIGYFALLFSLLIIILYHGETIKASAQALAGCIISGYISLLVTYLLIDAKLAYVFVMSVWIFIVVSLLVKYFLAMLISGVAATMIMYNSIYSSVSYTTNLFENYLLQLLIAIVVSVIIDALVWPNRTRGVFSLTFKAVFQDFSDLFSSYKDGINSEMTLNITSTSLITFSHLATYLNRMQREEGGDNFPLGQYTKIITFTRGIFIKIEVLEEYILKDHVFMQNQGVKEQMDQILTLLSQFFLIFSRSAGTNDIINIDEKALRESILALHETYQKLHEVQDKNDDYYEDLIPLGAMLPLLDDISDKAIKIEESINLFHSGDYKKMVENRVTHSNKVEQLKARSFFSIDRESARVGIKTVVIFLLLMFGEVVLSLPGGGQVVFFAILFGIIPNLGQAYMKSRYGLIGVTAGLTMSFLSLMILAAVPHFLIVIGLYSLGSFIAAYVASSSKDISAAGLQAGLLFPFGILLTTGPQVNISDAATRFLALLSAVFVGMIVQYLLWPSNPFEMLRRKISDSIKISGRILTGLLINASKDRERADKLIFPLAASLPSINALLHDAEYIIRNNQLNSDQLVTIIECIERIYTELETLKKVISESTENVLLVSYMDFMKPNYERFDSIFELISSQMKSREDYHNQLRDFHRAIQERRQEYRKLGIWRTAPPGEVEQVVLITGSMDNLIDSLSQISNAIGDINQALPERKPLLQEKNA